MKVADVMTTELFTLERNQELSMADDIMTKRHIRHMPVLDDGRLVGILSQRDLLFAGLSNVMTGSTARERFLETLVVKEVMNEDVVTIASTADVREAAQLMLTHSFGCLPVVDEGELVGLVTETDLLRVLVEIESEN